MGRPALAGLLGATLLLVLVGVVGVTAALAGSGMFGGSGTLGDTAALAGEAAVGGGDDVSALARSEIPAEYLRLYLQAGARYGLDWAVLAGIGRVECDHGRDPDPACTQEGAVNSAGAGGPMQFLQSTWEKYGVSAYGEGPPNRWNPADAIYGAANYLRAAGAPGDYRAAIFAYNHAWWYVEDVLSWAARYSESGSPPVSAGTAETVSVGTAETVSVGATKTVSVGTAETVSAGATARKGEAGRVAGGGGGAAGVESEAGATLEGTGLEGADTRLAAQTATPVRFIPGERAVLSPSNGHVALIPAGVPAAVQAMVVAGNELQDLPYGPDGHPDPLGAPEEDCSSTVNYVLYRAGVRPLAEIVKDNPLAQDYVHWGAPGPGRWVTIYATDAPTPHVFIVIAGLRLDTSHNGTDIGPNREEDGPRWRILPYIPTWAHWSVRHPPGL
jgi:hypothetical protein